jgi:hypothetical protein
MQFLLPAGSHGRSRESGLTECRFQEKPTEAYPRSAKDAERTTEGAGNRFAPRSVLPEFLEGWPQHKHRVEHSFRYILRIDANCNW